MKPFDPTQGKHKVIAIVGPTASGKSALGVFLAQKLSGEIISADSRQVYRGLNIGTGKVTKKEMGGIPHHLLDVASPKKQFSASDFTKQATKAIEKIITQEKVPLVVGGTGFYIDALLGRITLPDVPPNPRLRAKLEKKSVEELFAMLQKKDPERAKTVEPKHKRRIIRALEIAHWHSKNKPEGDLRSATARARANFQQKIMRTPEGLLFAEPKPQYDILWLGISPEEKVLHKKIHVRLLARMKLGMVAEAKRLHIRGLSYKRMKELGLEYRSLAEFLLGEKTKEEMLASLEGAIQDYAKRQMRWFKRNTDIVWVSNPKEALTLAKAFIGGQHRPKIRMPAEHLVATFRKHRNEVARFKELLDRQIPLAERVPRGRFLPRSLDAET